MALASFYSYKKNAMKFILLTTALSIALFSCTQNKALVKEEDYTQYLNRTDVPQALTIVNQDIAFWGNRLNDNKDDVAAQIKLAGNYSQLFSLTGSIMYLHSADSLFTIANKVQRKFGAGVYRSLAGNAITQHQFKKAMAYIDSALALGDDKYISMLMKADIAMELGLLNIASQQLFQLADKNSFSYLIREAKLWDKKGDLDKAVTTMEAAYAKIKNGNNEALKEWTITNLADMYGHQNNFSKSYAAYLQALNINPHNYHALKGIAWMAFSHDNNYAAAKKILAYLKAIHPIPDYDLLLAQIEEVNGNTVGKEKYETAFLQQSSLSLYGEMYNRYQYFLCVDNADKLALAANIAAKEVDNRAVPESYALLALSKTKQGFTSEGLAIAQQHVENKTAEPLCLFILGECYRASNNKVKAQQYLTEALEAAYELGPIITKRITTALKSI
jgi:Tfp pilus assembly protein PilF